MKLEIPEYSVLEQIDENNYRYSYSAAYVNIIKDPDGTWYYTRLNNISRSYHNYASLQECINVAFDDMIHAKL